MIYIHMLYFEIMVDMPILNIYERMTEYDNYKAVKNESITIYYKFHIINIGYLLENMNIFIHRY